MFIVLSSRQPHTRHAGKAVAKRLRWLTVFALLTSTGMARAESLPDEEPPQPRRYEFLPVPNIGGNSDVGLELGAAFTIVRFYDDERPYRWLVGGVLTTSFKNDADGFRPVQQYHVLRLDVPNLFGGRVRINSVANFARAVNARYFGLGNASVSGGLLPGPEPSRQNQYLSEEVRLRSLARIKTGTLFDAAFAVNLRYETPSTYAGSKLAFDAANSNIPGTESAFLSGISAGVILDTRDSEFFPRKGVYYQLGGAATVGSAERVAYGEVAAVLSSYFPLGRYMTFATRLFASFQFGRAPFYDLQQGGVFFQQYMVGSDRGVRGVPGGRYAGHVKMMANYELRTTFIPRFRVLRWMLQVGTTTFLDAGRVWDDYETSALDGTTPGIKYGVGGGFFFQWDRSSVFRVELAYSPTDHAINSFPLAYYIANGITF